VAPRHVPPHAAPVVVPYGNDRGTTLLRPVDGDLGDLKKCA